MKIATLSLTAALAAFAAGGAEAATVKLFCGATDYDLCSSAAEAWAKQSGNTVSINKMPAVWDDAVPLYQQMLAAKSTDVDVLVIDVIWMGMLKNHLLDLGAMVPKEEVAAHFPTTIDAATIDGHLLALPWYMDTGLIFYRKDLLEKYGKPVPKTWAELTETAKAVQDGERKAGDADMWGFVWQGKSYEGLTCDAIEWVASTGGGTIIDAKGDVTIDNPKAAQALTLAHGWIDTISPQGVLGYDEESSRAVFESGKAVFLRNWPYVWGTSQAAGGALVGKVGVAALPVGAQGEKSSGCLGPAYLGVSKYSENKEAAVELIRYMTGAADQKRRAIQGAYNPTVTALYEDPEVLAKLPFLKDTQAAFADSIARPSAATGASYNRVSQAFSKSVHAVLTGDEQPDAAVAALAKELERLRQRAKW
ncbi:ABC transporter substrate-binding protein [Inquilinus sp. NPDC058860]|uniref:ABC transporter substrate-binding protein n=1 Tax=Inquilinus sp. NPDC058860 TaxID=3346652 RepID=UPI0036B5FBE1